MFGWLCSPATDGEELRRGAAVLAVGRRRAGEREADRDEPGRNRDIRRAQAQGVGRRRRRLAMVVHGMLLFCAVFRCALECSVECKEPSDETCTSYHPLNFCQAGVGLENFTVSEYETTLLRPLFLAS
jgi:hypothetical protein